MNPFRRVSVSVNDEPEHLGVLPPLDDSLIDKILILKCYKHPMPMPMTTPEEEAAFRAKIREELPAYLAYLLKMEIPAELIDSRFGFKAYQNDEIVEAIEGKSPESQMLEMMDEVFRGEKDWGWLGSALKMFIELTQDHSLVKIAALKLLPSVRTCGIYLGRLADKHPKRVKQYRGHGGSNKYRVFFPAKEVIKPGVHGKFTPEEMGEPAGHAPVGH